MGVLLLTRSKAQVLECRRPRIPPMEYDVPRH